MRRSLPILMSLAAMLGTAPPAPASYDAKGPQRDAMIQALGGTDDPDCWETIVSTEDATWGIGFHYFDQGCTGVADGPHYLLRSNPDGSSWRVVRQVADGEYDRHGGQCPFAGVPTPVAEDFALCSLPVPCSKQRATADWVSTDLILYAQRAWPAFYKGAVPADWFLYKVICADLIGDGHLEMIAQLGCCTLGAPDPWAIYKRDSEGRWQRVYAEVRADVWQLHHRGRAIVGMSPAEYAGACTTRFRDRVVRWSHGRFHTRLGPVYSRKAPCR